MLDWNVTSATMEGLVMVDDITYTRKMFFRLNPFLFLRQWLSNFNDTHWKAFESEMLLVTVQFLIYMNLIQVSYHNIKCKLL